VNAVVTAGGRIDGPYARAAGTTVKALVRVRGRTLLERAIAAVRGAGIGRIAVVGNDDVASACRDAVDRIVPDRGDGAANVLAALHAFADDPGTPVLLMVSDLPFVEPTHIRAFLSRVPPATLALALARYEEFQERFPGLPDPGIRCREGRVVNGGALVIPPGAAAVIVPFAARFFEARKSLLRMARLAGIGTLLRFVTGTLSLPALERRASGVLGIPARAIVGMAPELAFDLDDLQRFHYALRVAGDDGYE